MSQVLEHSYGPRRPYFPLASDLMRFVGWFPRRPGCGPYTWYRTGAAGEDGEDAALHRNRATPRGQPSERLTSRNIGRTVIEGSTYADWRLLAEATHAPAFGHASRMLVTSEPRSCPRWLGRLVRTSGARRRPSAAWLVPATVWPDAKLKRRPPQAHVLQLGALFRSAGRNSGHRARVRTRAE